MNISKTKNYVIGFLLGLSLIFLLGAMQTWYVDGHCQSSLSNIGQAGEVYLAITNTATGQTIVHRFDRGDFARTDNITFDAEAVNKRYSVADAQR
jgi:hypothetical protein